MTSELVVHSEVKLNPPMLRFIDGKFGYPPEMTLSHLLEVLSHEGVLLTSDTFSVILQTEELGLDLYINILVPDDKQLIGYQKVTIEGDEAKNLYKRYSDIENLHRYGSQGLFKSSSSIFFEVLRAKGVKTVTGRVRVDNIASIKSGQLVIKLFQPNDYYKSELRNTYSDDEKDLVTYLD